MHLIILNQFFYPDHSATSQLMTALAEDLVRHGIKVTSIASQGSYNGGRAYAKHEVHRGVRIERVWATSFGKRNLLGRLTDYVTFYLGACWRLLRLPRDTAEETIVMALTTPPLIGLVAWLVGRWRGLRFIALQEDMYPDVAVALGALPADGLITRLLDWMACLMLRQADRVIVLSDCMLERVLAKIEPASGAAAREAARARIDVIHNWADGREIAPLANDKARFWRERGLPELGDKLVILFSGNLGLVNEFTTVLEAARLLNARSDIAFVFIGAGARSAETAGFVEQHQLNNIVMLPYQPRAEVRRSLSAGDALLITLGQGLAGLSVPSKTYSSLAAGRPLLFVGDERSSSAALIKRHQCGAALGCGESAALAQTLLAWASDQSLLAEMGLRARQVFEQYYDRPHAVQAYLRSFALCTSRSQQSTGAALNDYSSLKTVNLKDPVA
ncbi:MAG: glycosyltransferase family 4 protein [Acidobacteria bacterium]|nr:glycosyltransferase family 4 protein [Acidobacteriota bacterium]MBI3425566.1 glycosyltransferase family 4 protein [Acidobacteriota bacterium]